jgi:hypothetical protein
LSIYAAHGFCKRIYFMKPRILFAALAIGSGISFIATSSQAQQAPSPCQTYKCVATISGYGSGGGNGCAPALQTFFKIAVFNPPLGSDAPEGGHKFDPDATTAQRRKYLLTCPDAAADNSTLTAILDKWRNVK